MLKSNPEMIHESNPTPRGETGGSSTPQQQACFVGFTAVAWWHTSKLSLDFSKAQRVVTLRLNGQAPEGAPLFPQNPAPPNSSRGPWRFLGGLSMCHGRAPRIPTEPYPAKCIQNPPSSLLPQVCFQIPQSQMFKTTVSKTHIAKARFAKAIFARAKFAEAVFAKAKHGKP